MPDTGAELLFLYDNGFIADNGIPDAWQDESGGVMTDELGNPIIFID